jgi:DNA (cytosine-5)-methyltransferase 1
METAHNQLTLCSLFDGSGGFPLGALLAGIKPVSSSEIVPFATLVTSRRLPDVKHYGDVSEIKGSDLEPVDIITFGSPCQDMSIAGRRVGLDGERSGLFYQAIRIIKEMREATDGKYPRYCVWENVPGAFSSNGGDDFKAVIEAVIGVKEEGIEVPAPDKNKWPKADVYLGDGWSLAYRVFDTQYWGCPQRRKRIYLVADFAGERAGEILFESESLRGNSQESGEAREDPSGNAEGSIRRNDQAKCLNPWDVQGKRIMDISGVAGSLYAGEHTFGGGASYIAYCLQGNMIDRTDKAGCDGKGFREDVSYTLNTIDRPAVVTEIYAIDSMSSNSMKSSNPHSGFHREEIAKTLDTHPDPTCNQGGNVVVCSIDCRNSRLSGDKSGALQAKECGGYSLNFINPVLIAYPIENHAMDSRVTLKQPDEPCQTLSSRMGTGGCNVPMILEAVSVGNGQLHQMGMEEVARPLDCMHDQQVVLYKQERKYIVRRLTPTECARLQGFPDWWCADLAIPDPTDEQIAFWTEVWETYRKVTSPDSKPKTEKQIRRWLASPYTDANEYKLWGNGISLPIVYFVLSRIVKVTEEEKNNENPVF